MDKSDKIKVGVAVVLILAAVVLLARVLFSGTEKTFEGPEGEEQTIQQPTFN